MINKKTNKLDELLKIVNITEEELENLNYKEKQKYFKAKNKLGNIVFISRDKNGRGLTYRKPKEVK